MALVFKHGEELTLLEKKTIGEIGEKNKDKQELESKEKVRNDTRKTWTNPASQTSYIELTVRGKYF